MIILLLLVLLAIGFVIGYKTGQWYSNGINSSLRTQVDMLTVHSRHWAQEATNKYELSEQISAGQARQVTATLQTVIYMLQVMQKEQQQSLSNEEQKKISQIIHNTKEVLHP